MNNVRKLMTSAEADNQTSLGSEKLVLQATLNFIENTFEMFGVSDTKSQESNDDLQMENLVNSIVNVRNQIRIKAKEEKNKELFKMCDTLRDAFKEHQIEIKDHGNLSTWSKKLTN
jgi:cysteinyl-tRNA synthetase